MYSKALKVGLQGTVVAFLCPLSTPCVLRCDSYSSRSGNTLLHSSVLGLATRIALVRGIGVKMTLSQ